MKTHFLLYNYEQKNIYDYIRIHYTYMYNVPMYTKKTITQEVKQKKLISFLIYRKTDYRMNMQNHCIFFL